MTMNQQACLLSSIREENLFVKHAEESPIYWPFWSDDETSKVCEQTKCGITQNCKIYLKRLLFSLEVVLLVALLWYHIIVNLET